jgi:transcription termination factor Rho
MQSYRNNYPRNNNSNNNNYGRGNYRPNNNFQRPMPQEQRRVTTPGEQKFLAGTAIDPSPRIILENGSNELSMRAMDLMCPIGMGQRGLIVASPGLGKTTFLKHIAHSVTKGYPHIKLYCLLVDERPEEITDFKRATSANIFYSSMDQSYENHIATADKLMNEAFNDASQGKDVLVLIDSLTRLARVHNAQRNSGGRTLSGGVDARALEVPRRIFGAARKIQEGGSLGILATILVDTNSRMDDVIFEEFKGTGNMEIVLSKELAQRRIFPAIDVFKSNTRKSELLLDKEEVKRIDLLRRGLADMNKVEAMEALLRLLEKYPTNNELLYSFKLTK